MVATVLAYKAVSDHPMVVWSVVHNVVNKKPVIQHIKLRHVREEDEGLGRLVMGICVTRLIPFRGSTWLLLLLL